MIIELFYSHRLYMNIDSFHRRSLLLIASRKIIYYESTRARIINRHKQTLLYVSALLTHARERQLRLQGVLYIYIVTL